MKKEINIENCLQFIDNVVEGLQPRKQELEVELAQIELRCQELRKCLAPPPPPTATAERPWPWTGYHVRGGHPVTAKLGGGAVECFTWFERAPKVLSQSTMQLAQRRAWGVELRDLVDASSQVRELITKCEQKIAQSAEMRAEFLAKATSFVETGIDEDEGKSPFSG